MSLLAGVERQKELGAVSTFGIGGPARYYCVVYDAEALQTAWRWGREQGLPIFILGKGSNSIFDDAGYDGLVIHNKIDIFEETEPGVFRVGAGYSFARLGVKTARSGWAGLEFASGIPASVGGAVFMNAGANGQETADVVEKVEYLVPSGAIITIEGPAFRYRWSMFQEMSGCIVAAHFRLSASENARSKQLKIIEYRTATQPYDQPSAGCVFRNPGQMPAGALIDELGLKGTVVGGAAVSDIHANFIVNNGAATSADVQALADQVAREVEQKTGIRLEREIRFVPPKGEQ